MTPVTDSHCHLTDERFNGDRSEVLARAQAAGVARIVSIGSSAADSDVAADLAESDPVIWSTAGVHPHEVHAATPEHLERIEHVVSRPRTVAVGETGLDFHYDNSPREDQRAWFMRHLELAARTDMPIVVHARSADADVAEFIDRYRGRVRGVVHCFTGERPLLEAALAAGWFIGYGGIATFKRFEAADLVRAVPADRLLLETDAPYLAPEPHRGKRNEPAFVVESLARIAALRGEPVDVTARQTSDNATALFGLPAS